MPERLRARQLKEEAAYGRIWRRLFDEARADGQLRDDLDARLAQLLVIGALNWCAGGSTPAAVRWTLCCVECSSAGYATAFPRRVPSGALARPQRVR